MQHLTSRKVDHWQCVADPDGVHHLTRNMGRCVQVAVSLTRGARGLCLCVAGDDGSVSVSVCGRRSRSTSEKSRTAGACDPPSPSINPTGALLPCPHASDHFPPLPLLPPSWPFLSLSSSCASCASRASRASRTSVQKSELSLSALAVSVSRTGASQQVGEEVLTLL